MADAENKPASARAPKAACTKIYADSGMPIDGGHEIKFATLNLLPCIAR